MIPLYGFNFSTLEFPLIILNISTLILPPMSIKSQPITTLGIETSCDDTAVSIVRHSKGTVEILASIISSQITLHSEYGGVVPSLAAREHTKNLLPLLKDIFRKTPLSPNDIDALAVTHGPGLIPALLVGTTVARTLSWLWKKPLLGIHHIEGHIYANAITQTSSLTPDIQFPDNLDGKSKFKFQKSTFPILALVVSGGHTQLILIKKHFDYTIVGETQDDAVGEAFDKVARILGLGYPGGPAVSRRAGQQFATKNKELGMESKNSSLFFTPLPRPMLNSPNFNFSFSGLKTAVLYTVQKFREENSLDEQSPLPDEFINVICAEFQQATIDVLVKKTIKATQKYCARTVILAGGVSANTELREQLSSSLSKSLPLVTCHLSPVALSTDNAAMIASAGAFRFAKMSPKEREKTKENWRTLETRADLTLTHEQT